MKRNGKSTDAVADDAGEAQTKERSGVQSIGRAFSIVEEVARNRDGISLAELSKHVGLHNSTTFHLVKTMVSLGYLRQSKDTKKYRVGRSLFALAASSFDEIEMANLSMPVLEELSRKTEESGHVAIRMGDLITIIAKSAAPGAFQLAGHAGVVRPMYCTALGKIILAAMPEDQFEDYLARVKMEPLAPKSITDPDRLRQDIADVRESGLAYDDGEFNAELRCVAIPVYGFSGEVVAAIGISGPVWRLSLASLKAKSDAIREAARILSEEFGYGGVTAEHQTATERLAQKA
jgi:DNA-binding IclR family transcriptional regulator